MLWPTQGAFRQLKEPLEETTRSAVTTKKLGVLPRLGPPPLRYIAVGSLAGICEATPSCTRAIGSEMIRLPIIGAWVKPLALFAATFTTCFVVYFLYSDLFGLYSDDQYLVAVYNKGQAIQALVENGIAFGRPIGFLAVSILYPLLAIGGVSLAYVGSCLVLTAETFFVIIFFRRFFSATLSFVLGLVYLLFPADASKFLFIHSFMTHVSAIMFWMSAILYTRGHPVLAALLASSSMLVYETHLAPAIFIPLLVFALSQLSELKRLDCGRELRQCAEFLFSFSVISSLLLMARVLFAPGRIPAELSGGPFHIVERLLSAGVLGIRSVIASHLDRLDFLAASSAYGIYIIILILILFNLLAWTVWHDPVRPLKLRNSIQHDIVWAIILVICGFSVMYVSYLPFALEPARWPPTPIYRRASGVHLAASVGYVLVWAGIFRGMMVLQKPIGLLISGVLFVPYAVIMTGFFLLYQQGLVENWSLQTVYWHQIDQCIRRTDPKLIIVDSDEEQERKGQVGMLFDWTTAYMPFLLKKIAKDPADWPLVEPRAVLDGKIELVGDKMKLASLPTWYVYPTELEIKVSDIILVKPFKGGLVAPTTPIMLGAVAFSPLQVCYSTLSSM
jgi:hypothetical protein